MITLMKNLLITGASGFVGRSVVDYISSIPKDQRPESITLVSRTVIVDLDKQVMNDLNLKYVQADLLNEWSFDSSFTHVLQLAADGSELAYSEKAAEDFVKFTQRLIEWCETLASKPVVVHASSGACFGYFPLGSSNDSAKNWSKLRFVEGRLEAEHLLQSANRREIFDLRIARLFSFIGSHIRGKIHYAVPSFISMAKTSGIIRLTGDPMTVRSYLSALEMSQWIVAALNANSGLPLLSIGSSVPVRMFDLAEFVAEQFSAKVEVESHEIAGDRYVADNQITKTALGVDEAISWKRAIVELID